MNEGQIMSSCDSNEYEETALTVEQALENILNNTQSLNKTESIKLEDSLHRVLAEDCYALNDVPPHRNSAMDGFAIHADDIKNQTLNLKVIGDSLAGKPFKGQVKAGECVRIMTGAVMPEACNSVVMVENTSESGSSVILNDAVKDHVNVRESGEDIKAKEQAIAKGKRITPSIMGFLHACGIADVAVYQKPNVSFFTTGDELKQPGETLGLGDIYDSNRLSLIGMLSETHCEHTNLGIIADDKDKLREAFAKAQKSSDCVISTGGVSVGAADHIKDILKEHGQPNFWRIAMKPGRPLTFGHLNNGSLFFGLPGNPVSAMATYYLFVLPALRKLSGEDKVLPQRLKARCKTAIRKREGRTDYQRGYFSYNDNELVVDLAGKQQSHLLSGMSQANCFIELSREQGNLEADENVTIIPFSGLMG